MNLCDYLLEGKPSGAAALLTMSGSHTYGELKAAADGMHSLLGASGAQRGDCIILRADNSFFWVASYLGIVKAGMVCVPLPTATTDVDFRYIVQTTEAKVLFTQQQLAAKFRSDLGIQRVVTDLEVLKPASRYETNAEQCEPCTNDNEIAALMFTSGSTGRPRGVMVTHANIIANTESIIQSLSLTRSDRIMAVLPFHYCFGTSLLHTHLRVGGSLVLDSRFMYPEAVLTRLRDTQCTGFAGVPSHFQILLRRSRLSSMEFPHLRYVQQAGGQLAPAFIRELREAIPRTMIFIMYGQTEATARLSCLPPEHLENKAGSVGRGVPGVHLTVINGHGRPVAPGEIGEIVAEGRNVAMGYWKDPEETSRTFRNGKLHTGDLATVDEDGFIYIVDRAKDFLKCGGKRVSSRQLENVLLMHPALIEAAVVGEPDAVLGEAAVAYVVARDPRLPPSSEQLKAHCREQLPPGFVPKRFVTLRSLPKNSSGKVLKIALRTEMTNAVAS